MGIIRIFVVLQGLLSFCFGWESIPYRILRINSNGTDERGSSYSLGNTNPDMSHKTEKYWDFSWHEMVECFKYLK